MLGNCTARVGIMGIVNIKKQRDFDMISGVTKGFVRRC